MDRGAGLPLPLGLRIRCGGLHKVQNSIQTVVVLGASPKPWRYAFQAISLLKRLGHRVILNPGAESDELQRALDAALIRWEHACTLVLLRTGQF